MHYQTGSAFRRALEDRLRAQNLQTSIPLSRLRKMVAFDRFLARLVLDQPGHWVLKGGLALQLRIGARARTTKDIDLLSLVSSENLIELLSMAARLDLHDWFAFEVEDLPSPLVEEAQGSRYSVRSLVDGRVFESFHVDVGIGDPVSSPIDVIATPPTLAFAEIPPTSIPCYPLPQHLAEKIHAYSRPYPERENSRVKDLVDILLIMQEYPIDAQLLLRAIDETFSVRQTHAVPSELPEPPFAWRVPFRKMAEEVGLTDNDLVGGYSRASRFVNPVLARQVIGRWNPDRQVWESLQFPNFNSIE